MDCTECIERPRARWSPPASWPSRPGTRLCHPAAPARHIARRWFLPMGFALSRSDASVNHNAKGPYMSAGSRPVGGFLGRAGDGWDRQVAHCARVQHGCTTNAVHGCNGRRSEPRSAHMRLSLVFRGSALPPCCLRHVRFPTVPPGEASAGVCRLRIAARADAHPGSMPLAQCSPRALRVRPRPPPPPSKLVMAPLPVQENPGLQPDPPPLPRPPCQTRPRLPPGAHDGIQGFPQDSEQHRIMRACPGLTVRYRQLLFAKTWLELPPRKPTARRPTAS